MEEKTLLRDKDIREPLFDFLEERYGKSRIFEEKMIGRVRADVVMVTPGRLYGIEIKSDADTYARLKKQVEQYDLYYDRNILVVGSSHAAHASEHVPEWWGIISVEYFNDRVDFYVRREPADNPRALPERKIEVLWRPELNRILAANGFPAYKYKSKRFVQEYLLANLPEDRLWPQACEELFERDYNTIAQEINEFRKQNGQAPRRKKRKTKYNRRKQV